MHTVSVIVYMYYYYIAAYMHYYCIVAYMYYDCINIVAYTITTAYLHAKCLEGKQVVVPETRSW